MKVCLNEVNEYFTTFERVQWILYPSRIIKNDYPYGFTFLFFYLFLFIFTYFFLFFLWTVVPMSFIIRSRRVFLLFVTIEKDDLNSLDINKEREKNILLIDKWSTLFEIGNMSQQLKLDRKLLQLCNKIYNEGSAIKKKKKRKTK